MEMEDWTYALAIALSAVVWVTIFVDYRKKLMRVMPAVDQVSHRKQEFSNKISEAENSAQEIAMSIDGMRREIEGLEDQRVELQDKLNEQEMIFISAGQLKLGSDQVGRGGYHTNRMDIRALSRASATPNMYQDFIGFRCAMNSE